MKLRDLSNSDLEKVAKKAETTVGYLKQIKYGERRPSPELARRIVKAVNGLISLEELLFAPEYQTKKEEKKLKVKTVTSPFRSTAADS